MPPRTIIYLEDPELLDEDTVALIRFKMSCETKENQNFGSRIFGHNKKRDGRVKKWRTTLFLKKIKNQ